MTSALSFVQRGSLIRSWTLDFGHRSSIPSRRGKVTHFVFIFRKRAIRLIMTDCSIVQPFDDAVAQGLSKKLVQRGK